MLSIIIVNWNNKELLRKCLQSIFQYTRGLEFEVVLVDNASTDGSPDMVRQEFPQVVLLPQTTNLRFGPGNNLGFEASRGDYVLYLNQDTEIRSDVFSPMVNWLAQHPQVGILGPKLLNTDGTLQRSCRRLPTWWSQVLILLKIHNAFPWLPAIKNYYMFDFDHESEREVEQVMGACFLMPRHLVLKTGGFHPSFTYWMEEVDLCLQVKQLGYQIYFNPEFEVYHHKGASSKMDPNRQKRFNQAVQIYFRKNKPYWQYLIIKAVYPFAIGLWYIGAVVQRLKIMKKNKNL